MSQRKRVLLAWETGAGLGHARRLLVIASALAARGFEPIVAARDVRSAYSEYRKAGIPVIQAPNHRGFLGDKRSWRAQSYADLMAACAWDDVAALEPTVAAWGALIELIDPALVIADFCPILPLATRSRVPLLVIGDGFVVPPPEGARMPALLQLDRPCADEEMLMRNGNEVLARRGREPITSLPSLIGGDRQVVCTYPEIDVYASLRCSPASGALEKAPRLPPPTSRGIFVYLAANHQGTAKCLQAVAESGLPARAFIRDADETLKTELRKRNVFVHDARPDLLSELVQASIILHHGGIGTAEIALASGRPQILLPRHLEQKSNAQCLLNAGVAGMIRQKFEVLDALMAIRNLSHRLRLEQRAAAIAAVIEKRTAETGLDHITQAVADLV